MRWLAAVLVLVVIWGCSEKQKEAARLEAQMKQQDQGKDTAMATSTPDSLQATAQETTSVSPQETAPADQNAQATQDTGVPVEAKVETTVTNPAPTMAVQETTTRRADSPISVREVATEPAPDAGAIPPSDQKVTVQPATRPQTHPVSGYVIQIASSPDEQDARSVAAKFAERGYSSHVTEGQVGGKTYYRVRIGAYGTSTEANQVLAEMAQKYGVKGFVTQVR